MSSQGTGRAIGRVLTVAAPIALAPMLAIGADAPRAEAASCSKYSPRVGLADANPQTYFLDSGKKASFDFKLKGNRERDLIVKVKKLSDGKTRSRWRVDDVAPGERTTVRWDGKTKQGKAARNGRYAFRIYEPGGCGTANMRKASGNRRLKLRRSAGTTDSGAGTTRARMSTTATRTKKHFLDSGHKARFDFELAGNRRRDLVVKVKKLSGGKTRSRWRFDDVKPGERMQVRWNGRNKRGGFSKQGKHVFKVYMAGGRGPADMSDASGKKRFGVYKHRFPIHARHSYGDGFGAGRGHQGADVFANCGKRMRAARGGRVQTRSYQSSAGNYLVIDAKGTGYDYVYMHMKRRGLPKQGERIRTGERIGYVGETGNASGCHLHFELWSGPGWYEGGSAQPPTARLKRWDSWS